MLSLLSGRITPLPPQGAAIRRNRSNGKRKISPAYRRIRGCIMITAAIISPETACRLSCRKKLWRWSGPLNSAAAMRKGRSFLPRSRNICFRLHKKTHKYSSRLKSSAPGAPIKPCVTAWRFICEKSNRAGATKEITDGSASGGTK